MRTLVSTPCSPFTPTHLPPPFRSRHHCCRRGADGSELLHVPLGEEVLRQVLADVDAMA